MVEEFVKFKEVEEGQGREKGEGGRREKGKRGGREKEGGREEEKERNEGEETSLLTLLAWCDTQEIISLWLGSLLGRAGLKKKYINVNKIAWQQSAHAVTVVN